MASVHVTTATAATAQHVESSVMDGLEELDEPERLAALFALQQLQLEAATVRLELAAARAELAALCADLAHAD